MQFSLLHIIYKCFLDSGASCRGRSGALLGVLRGNGPVWWQAFVGEWVRLPACVFVAGRMTQYGALAVAAHCIAHCIALRLTGGQAVVSVFVASPGMSGAFVRSPWAAASAALSRLSSPAGLEKRVRQYTPVCVLAHSWYVVNPCRGRVERQDRGVPVPRRRAGSPIADALLLVEQDYAAVIFAVEIDFYTAVHEELAGEGIALPVVFAAVCVHLAKGVACVGIEAGKHEAGA